MDKLKPYTYWIVCGMFLLVEILLVASGMFWPGMEQPPAWAKKPSSNDLKGMGIPKKVKGEITKALNPLQNELKKMETPQDVARVFGEFYDGGKRRALVAKQTVRIGEDSRRAGGVKLLEMRAANLKARRADGVTREVNPADRKDIDAFFEEYLVREGWESTLTSKIGEYRSRAQRMEEKLSDKSGILTEVVSNANEEGKWYTEYTRATVEFLKTIIDGDLIKVSEQERDQLDTARGLRERFLIETRTTKMPTEEEQGRLNEQFNLARAILLALLEAKGTVLADEMFIKLRETGRLEAQTPAPPADVPDLARVRVRRLKLLGRENASGGKLRVWRVALEMQGTPAALMGAMRVLDGMEAPIIVRLGSTWKALDPGRGDLKDVDPSDSRMEVTTQLGVCDFLVSRR